MAHGLSFSSIDHCKNFDTIAKILLIGDTGSGKSTFINYLYNYFHQSDLNNLKIAIPSKYHPSSTEEYLHDELNIYDNTQSKTNTCTQYIFTDSLTHKQYLFLDTPGLSDTRGSEQNEININKILDAITQLGNLTTVIIVINGSISRLTTNLRSVIAKLNGNIPDIILENVIVILTNVKKHESPFDLKILNLHGKVYPFYMQNNVFVSDSQTWSQTIYDELEINWNSSMNQIKLILQIIDSFKQLSINAFIQMKQIRNDIKLIIHQTRLELIQIQKIQNDLFQLDRPLRQSNQDYTQIQTIEIIDAPYHSTLCTNCNQICHNNCHLNETKIIGAQIISQCLVMNNGKCQQCRNHCSYIHHYHAKKTIQITYETLYDRLINIKNKHEKDYYYQNRNNYHEEIFTISETKQLLEKVLKQKINELKIKTMELCEICSSFNLIRELKYLIKQFKKETDLFENLETKIQNEQIIKRLTRLIHLVEENNQEKNHQKPSSMQIIYKDSLVEENKRIDIKILRTIDLFELHNKTIDRNLRDSILEEFYRRVQGKSTEPLSTPNEIMLINKLTDQYKQKTIQDLSYSYRKLQKQINDILNSNIFKLIDVKSELLIENFIVHTLLDEKEKTENIHQDQSFIETKSRSLSGSMNNSFPIPPYPTNETPLSPSRSSNSNLPPIGISHILSAPYPSSNQSSVLPALPSDYPTIHPSNNQQLQTGFRREDYRYDSTNTKISTSSIDHQDSMPMPTNNQQPPLPNLHFSFNNTIEHQHTMPSNIRPPRSNVMLLNSDSLDSSKSQSHHLTADLDYEKFRSLDTSHLLSMYTNVNTRENEARKTVIYQELERRCYGEYPMLIKEKKNYFQERLKMNELKTIEELLIAQTNIKQKIRGYLKNDDVTLIHNIPVELIIEASTLNQLILSKRKVKK